MDTQIDRNNADYNHIYSNRRRQTEDIGIQTDIKIATYYKLTFYYQNFDFCFRFLKMCQRPVILLLLLLVFATTIVQKNSFFQFYKHFQKLRKHFWKMKNLEKTCSSALKSQREKLWPKKCKNQTLNKVSTLSFVSFLNRKRRDLFSIWREKETSHRSESKIILNKLWLFFSITQDF